MHIVLKQTNKKYSSSYDWSKAGCTWQTSRINNKQNRCLLLTRTSGPRSSMYQCTKKCITYNFWLIDCGAYCKPWQDRGTFSWSSINSETRTLDTLAKSMHSHVSSSLNVNRWALYTLVYNQYTEFWYTQVHNQDPSLPLKRLGTSL